MKVQFPFLLAAVLVFGNACSKIQPATPAEPELMKTATIRDIMDSMVEPSGEFLFESVVTIADEHGVTEKAPETDEEWQEVRRRAVTLVEAPNLLVMPGRKAAQPGEKAENPQVELPPEEIQKLIDGNRVNFINHAKQLQEAALTTLKAIDTKDKKALFDALMVLDKACENCHLEYWYPGEKKK